MSSSLLSVTFGVRDVAEVARFWADMLRRDVVETADGALLHGDDRQVGLGFVRCDAEKRAPNRVHLHLTSSTGADQKRTVEEALGLGARHLDVGQRPEEGHVVLADPADNELCVIEPGNSFLADCGFLGELACDGGREVGLFWSQALDWPLVWDQGQETAIQSPLGGTKIAWGGPSANPAGASPKQRFDLTCDVGAARNEIARLISLGASRIGGHTLVDPEGNEFQVLERGH